MTDSEQCFDRLTRLAARALDVDVARICLDDAHRRFTGVQAREEVCERALRGEENPPGVLAVPIELRGTTVGAFVAAGEQSRSWTPEETALLEVFARTAAAEIELEMTLRASEEQRPRSHRAGTRLLIAEDDESMRRFIINALAPDGYSIVQAKNGREALDALRREDFDLAILDLIMPDLSGWDVLQHRATDPRMHQVPVIIVSARRGPDVARAVAFGIYGLLPKPFEPDDLRDMVRTCLGERRINARAMHPRAPDRDRREQSADRA